MLSSRSSNTCAKRIVNAARLAAPVLATVALAQTASAQEFNVLRAEAMRVFNWDVAAQPREDGLLGARLTIDDTCGVSSRQILDATTVPQTVSFTEVLGNLRYVDPAAIDFSNYGDGVMGVSLNIADGGVNWLSGSLVLAEDRFFDTVVADLDAGIVGGSCTETECIVSSRFPFHDVLAAPDSVAGREQEITGMLTDLIELCQSMPMTGDAL